MLTDMDVCITCVDRVAEPEVQELAVYLSRTNQRFSNSIHASTRVYTCRGPRAPYELHWNDSGVLGEDFIGSYGWSAPRELIDHIIAELMAGRAVQAFIFDSDSELRFQEVLELYIP